MIKYRLGGYSHMLEDDVRRRAYALAMEATVRPGTVVADIGTGTGYFAVLACRLGARRVYAIEPGEVIEVARQVARANGCLERIQFEQVFSTEITLPEPVDVVICDLRGVLPWFESHLASVADAKSRLLAGSGTLIQQEDRLWVSIASVPGQCRSIHEAAVDGIDMSPASVMLANQWFKVRLEPDQLLTPPVHAATLDYRQIDGSDLDAQVHLTAARNGVAHGIAAWFEATLAGGVTFSCSPGQDRVYGQAMFAWPRTVSVEAGDRIAVNLKARYTGSDYFWSWKTRVSRGESEVAAFEQSDFHGQFLSQSRLRRSAPLHVPLLTREGERDRFVLELFAQHQTIGAVADSLLATFPEAFRDRRHALAHVGELSLRYSR
jgi:protein arginine N-methyltransferase 1